MKVWRILGISLAAAIGLLIVFQLNALALVEKYNLDDLTAKSDIILVGKITAINSYMETGRGIYTKVTVSVEQPVKGQPGKEVEFQIPGGVVDGQRLWVEDVPDFTLGERTVVFLEESESTFNVCGWNQGKFSVKNDLVVERNQPLTSFITDINRSMKAQNINRKFSSEPISRILETPLEAIIIEPIVQEEFSTGWQTIMTDGFEDTFPGDWTLYVQSSATNAYWGKDNYRANSGSYSAFCAKDGDYGVDPPTNYPINVDAWMIYGPFSLADATDTVLNFHIWCETELYIDGLIAVASINDINYYYVDSWSGDSGGWQEQTFDLTNADTLGNLCGQPQVWISFIFISNDTNNYQGVFIDDVILAKYVSAGPSPEITLMSPSTASAGTGTQVTIFGTDFGDTQGTSWVGFWIRDLYYVEAPIVSWSDTEIVCEVPSRASSGDTSHGVVVVTPTGNSNHYPFTVTFSYSGKKWFLTNPMSEKYLINPNTSDCDNELQAILEAMQTWNDVDNADFYLEYGGATTINTFNGTENGYNEFYWINTNPDGFPSGWIAVNVGWSDNVTGEVRESDILFNDLNYTWDTSGSPSGSQMDVQNIATHELGHTFRLLDLYGSADSDKTMYGFGSSAELNKRSLEAEDIAGLQWIYPGTGTRGQYHVKITNTDDDDLTVYFKADTDSGYENYRQVYVPAGQTLTGFREVLANGSHQVSIKWTDPDKGTEDILSSEWLNVPIEGDTEFSFTIPNSNTGYITGHIYELDGTTPIENCNVYATDNETEVLITQTNTDADGYYNLSLPSGSYHVRACPSCSSLPFRDEWYDDVLDENDAANVTVTPGNTTAGINFSLERIITFPDSNLESAIRTAISKPSGDIYQSELLLPTELDASNRDIIDLTGLEYCENLEELLLYHNQIVDISPLSGLTKLTYLSLNENQISDISPLSGLTNLTHLSIHIIQTGDISPLSGLTNLTNLYLNGDQVSDISPIAGLTKLEYLTLWCTQISDISPLSGLTNLIEVFLLGNQISDISPLSGLSNLTHLSLWHNKISDISPLSGLTNLTYLSLLQNQISDISPLSGLTSLTNLNLNSNQIVNIFPLSGCSNLITLSINENLISDLLPLVNNTGIDSGDTVDVRNNPLSYNSTMVYIPELESRGVTVLSDTLPFLTDGEVSPSSGYISSNFTFAVTYSSVNNTAPASITVSIDGEAPQNMSVKDGEDGDYTNGEIFEFNTIVCTVIGGKLEGMTDVFSQSDGIEFKNLTVSVIPVFSILDTHILRCFSIDGYDGDYTNGEIFEFNTIGLAKDISHTFQFTANDGTDDATGDTGIHYGPTVSNTPPVLSGVQVSPDTGYITTTFTYSVTYTDADNDEPASMTVSIDGEAPLDMSVKDGEDGDYTNGEIFEFITSGLAKDFSHTFQFAANDGTDNATGDIGSHSGPEVLNRPPVADAGPDQMAIVSSNITLDGSGSFDADDDPLTYLWTQTGGSTSANLSDYAAVQPYFIPLVADNYTFSLVVNDGTDNSTNEAQVTINVRASNESPVLSQGMVTPASGYASGTYTYSVIYTDADNDIPISITISIDGNAPQNMTEADGDTNYTDGKLYKYSISGDQFSLGTHTFGFNASDGIDDAVPVSYEGPTVSAKSSGGGGGGGGGGKPAGITSLSDYILSNGTIRSVVTAKSDDGKVILIINKNTVCLTRSGIRLSRIEIFKMDEPPAHPKDTSILGFAYSLGPEGATFAPPATLTMPFNPDDLEDGVSENSLYIAFWNEDTGEWIKCEGCTVDMINHTISVPVSHFSIYAILMEPPEEKAVIEFTRPAAFSIGDLTISSLEVLSGDTVTISIKITNTGGTSGSYTINLKINDVVEQTETPFISAGLSKVVNFTVNKEKAGNYDVEVAGKYNSFTVKQLPEPVAFSIENLNITPMKVFTGETATISIKVSNTGGTTGSYTVNLKINGIIEESKEIILDAGASKTVSFTISKDTAGDYNIEINGQTGELKVLPEMLAVNWGLIIGIIAVIVIISVAIILSIRRRKNAPA